MGKMKVFLDSNIVSRGSEPYKSSMFRVLSNLCRRNLLEVYISEVVILELKKHFVVKFEKIYKETQRKIDLLINADLLTVFDDLFSNPDSQVDLNDFFDTKFESFVSHFGVIVVDVQESDTKNIVRDSVYRVLPFTDSAGAPGVMDYLISNSYKRVMSSSESSDNILICNDEKLIESFRDTKVSLFKSISSFLNDDKYNFLSSSLTNIVNYVENHNVSIEALTDHVTENSSNVGFYLMEKLNVLSLSINNIEAIEIINIFPLEEQEVIDFSLAVTYIAVPVSSEEDDSIIYGHSILNIQVEYNGTLSKDIQISSATTLDKSITYSSETAKRRLEELEMFGI